VLLSSFLPLHLKLLPYLRIPPEKEVAARLTWGQRLLQLIGLVCVLYAQGVQVLAAPDLELSDTARLLDLH
jgi:hypothetical protein